VNLRRNLWPDERISYHSAIYKRATYRAMIRDHNAGACALGTTINQILDGICAETSDARGILYRARARVLGYSS